MQSGMFPLDHCNLVFHRANLKLVSFEISLQNTLLMDVIYGIFMSASMF